MAFVDPIGDMITRIRNAQMRSLNNVKIPNSKFRAKILDVLKKEGYISCSTPCASCLDVAARHNYMTTSILTKVSIKPLHKK